MKEESSLISLIKHHPEAADRLPFVPPARASRGLCSACQSRPGWPRHSTTLRGICCSRRLTRTPSWTGRGLLPEIATSRFKLRETTHCSMHVTLTLCLAPIALRQKLTLSGAGVPWQ